VLTGKHEAPTGAAVIVVRPHAGVGAIDFGMTRLEVGAALGPPSRRGRRNQYDASDYDLYESRGFFVYYDAHDVCEAVELWRAAAVSYDGYELFAHPAHEARA
jgi:hypothetical protein